MVPPQARLNFWRLGKKTNVLGYCGACWRWRFEARLAIRSTATERVSLACVSVTAHAGPSIDARHTRVSGCGPKRPEKEVECAVVVRMLGVQTLPNVEGEHAPRTRARRRAVSCGGHHTSARLWRTRGPHRGQRQTSVSSTTVNWPRSLQTGGQAAAFALDLLYPRTLSRASASIKRAAAVSHTSTDH